MKKHYSTWSVLVTAIFIICGSSSAFANLTHRVAKGDTLYRIGIKYGVSYKDIMRANDLQKTTIFPNQMLVIPSDDVPFTAAKPTSSSAPKANKPLIAQILKPKSNVGDLPQLDKVQPYSYPPPSTSSEEDQLGLGYTPDSTTKYTPPAKTYTPPTPKYTPPAKKYTYTPPAKKYTPPASKPKSIVQAIPAPKSPTYRSQPKQKYIPKLFSQRRDVPAAAQYSSRQSHSCKQPKQSYPMPSFKNAVKSYNKVHYVKSGENGWKVSRNYNISLFRLRKANNLPLFKKIKPGMKLVIPSPR